MWGRGYQNNYLIFLEYCVIYSTTISTLGKSCRIYILSLLENIMEFKESIPQIK